MSVAPAPVPLVSCIMPTRDRRVLAAQAIQYFLRNDYPNKELVVVDDGPDPIRDLIPPDLTPGWTVEGVPRVRYIYLDGEHTIGAKRNVAVALASGSLIMHWDDDDWYGPERISAQTSLLLEMGTDLCALNGLLYYHVPTHQSWRFVRHPSAAPHLVVGGSLLYRRYLWDMAPYKDQQLGEDNDFLLSAIGVHPKDKDDPAGTQHVHGKLGIFDEPGLYIALLHGGNTAPKALCGAVWRRHDADATTAMMGTDLAFYRGAGRRAMDGGLPHETGLWMSKETDENGMPLHPRRLGPLDVAQGDLAEDPAILYAVPLSDPHMIQAH